MSSLVLFGHIIDCDSERQILMGLAAGGPLLVYVTYHFYRSRRLLRQTMRKLYR